MTIKASTGLRDSAMVTGSIRAALASGFIKIYSGSEPATADAALGGATLLCTVSLNSTGTGVSLDTVATDGVASKPTGEVWSGVNAATGTASFYRHVAPGDDGTLSTTQARVQGRIATAGADMNFTSTALVSGATQTVDFYTLALPTL
jgi:hypothetical protein